MDKHLKQHLNQPLQQCSNVQSTCIIAITSEVDGTQYNTTESQTSTGRILSCTAITMQPLHKHMQSNTMSHSLAGAASEWTARQPSRATKQ